MAILEPILSFSSLGIGIGWALLLYRLFLSSWGFVSGATYIQALWCTLRLHCNNFLQHTSPITCIYYIYEILFNLQVHLSYILLDSKAVLGVLQAKIMACLGILRGISMLFALVSMCPIFSLYVLPIFNLFSKLNN